MRSFGKWFCITLMITGPIIGGWILMMRGGVCAQSPGEVTPVVTPYQRLAATARSPFAGEASAVPSSPSSTLVAGQVGAPPPPMLLPPSAAAPVVQANGIEAPEPLPVKIPGADTLSAPPVSGNPSPGGSRTNPSESPSVNPPVSGRPVRVVEMVRATGVTAEPELSPEQMTTASFDGLPRRESLVSQTGFDDRPADSADIVTPAGLLPAGAAPIPATVPGAPPV
ncbi:MAG: hypothetical protein Q4C47_01990, partial [Planctomycetia bacterium]|nr:hypothetical protein [Planctomycetia bacterium]